MTNTTAAHLVTIAPTTISGHPAFLAECSACAWYDCRASDDAEAIVIRNANAHEVAGNTEAAANA